MMLVSLLVGSFIGTWMVGSLCLLTFLEKHRFSVPDKFHSPIQGSYQSLKVLEFDYLKRRDQTSYTEKSVPDGFFLTLNVHKIHFQPGLCPGPRWGSLRRLNTGPICL